MNTVRLLSLALGLAVGATSLAAAPKPKKIPPSVTVKDLALREAKACDVNHNGKIDASEMSQLRMAQAKNPKSYLYLFDDNGNKYLDDSEIAKIQIGHAKPPLTHQPGAKKKKGRGHGRFH